MTRVYRITNDVNHYQYFLTQRESESERLWMDCTPKQFTWEPPEVFIYQPLLRTGDLYQFTGGSLILSPLATERLRSHLEMAGELLPLPHRGVTYTVLNVMECINCLDHERTIWVERNGMRLHIDRYAFHPDRFSESDIFKIPETRRTAVLVVERDPDEGFLADLRRYNITGYTLTLLWDSNAPEP